MKQSVAMVTGASQGIGRATAVRLAQDFSALVLTARNAEALQEVAAEVKKSGADSLTAALDLRTKKSAENLVNQTLRNGRGGRRFNCLSGIPSGEMVNRHFRPHRRWGN